VPCSECDRILREEILATRRASEAQTRLQDFYPEPPFGAAAAEILRICQKDTEDTRANLLRIQSERAEHATIHALSLSR